MSTRYMIVLVKVCKSNYELDNNYAYHEVRIPMDQFHDKQLRRKAIEASLRKQGVARNCIWTEVRSV